MINYYEWMGFSPEEYHYDLNEIEKEFYKKERMELNSYNSFRRSWILIHSKKIKEAYTNPEIWGRLFLDYQNKTIKKITDILSLVVRNESISVEKINQISRFLGVGVGFISKIAKEHNIIIQDDIKTDYSSLMNHEEIDIDSINQVNYPKFRLAQNYIELLGYDDFEKLILHYTDINLNENVHNDKNHYKTALLELKKKEERISRNGTQAYEKTPLSKIISLYTYMLNEIEFNEYVNYRWYYQITKYLSGLSEICKQLNDGVINNDLRCKIIEHVSSKTNNYDIAVIIVDHFFTNRGIRVKYLIENNSSKITELEKSKNEQINGDEYIGTPIAWGVEIDNAFSKIAYMMNDGRVVLCKNSEGYNSTPSVVSMSPYRSEPIVGKKAEDLDILDPYYTQRLDLTKVGHNVKLIYGDKKKGEELVTTPEDVFIEVLKKLLNDAYKMTSSIVDNVVITIPINLGNVEKNMLERKCYQAPIKVIDVLEKPIAAAFYYCNKNLKDEEVVCVYNLEKTSFDITVLKISLNSISVIINEECLELCGEKWNAKMLELIIDKLKNNTGIDEEFEGYLLQELKKTSEKAERQLCYNESAKYEIKLDWKTSVEFEIGRKEFEDRTEMLLKKTIELTNHTINRVTDLGMRIDKILLSGDLCNMPQVLKKIKGEFDIPVLCDNPEMVVLKGACIYGEKMKK